MVFNTLSGGVLVLPSLLFIVYLVAPWLLYVFGVLLTFYFLWHVLWRFGLRKTYYSAILAHQVNVDGPKRSLHVCVIGAGAAGLVSVKELVGEGHKVTCFEKYAQAGGVFLYDEKKGGVYDSTVLTISNYTMAFSDFFEANSPCRYWKHAEYFQYLHNYANHFQLFTRAAFHFNTSVDSMARTSNGKWKIVTSGSHVGEHLFDAVAVCNGTHQHPRIPTYPGQDTSPITVVHSETYKRAKGDARFDGKKVVCVGIGETGADLASEVADVASKAFLSFRRAPFVIPRYPWNIGLPSDAFSSRAMFYCHHKYITAIHARDQALKAATDTPLGRWIFRGKLGLGDAIAGKIAELAVRSGGGPTDQFATKNEAFVHRLVAGTLTEKPEITQLEGSTVVFSDGSREDVDSILLCTGYVDRFPFLQGVDIKSVRSMYKHAFHPDIGDSVAFVGFVRPGTGGVPACAEMVARYFALLCSGTRRLPPDWRERAKQEELMEEQLLHLSAGRVRTLVMYGDFMETMAMHIGCAPSLFTWLLTHPRLWIQLLYGPMMGAQFRLQGPGACPEQAEKVILGAPIPTPPPFRLVQSIAAVLGWVGGAIAGFRPTSW